MALNLIKGGHLDTVGEADTGEVVSQEVNNHHVLSLVLGALAEGSAPAEVFLRCVAA